MKKLINTKYFIGIVVSCIFIVGCADDNQSSNPQRYSGSVDLGEGVHIYTDPVTKCEYFVAWNSSMTSRLAADGRPVCGH